MSNSWDVFVDEYRKSSRREPLGVDSIVPIQSSIQATLSDVDLLQHEIRAHCPYPGHDADSQTLRINLNPLSKYGIGFWKCYSCGRRGHFNDLAEYLGIDLLHSDPNPEFRNIIRLDDGEYEYQPLPHWKLNDLPDDYAWVRPDKDPSKPAVTISRRALEIVGAKLWDRQQTVPKRGDNGKPLKDKDGRFIVDHYVDELRIWMPVLAGGEVVAHVAALDGKREWYSKKYLNSKGDWPKRFIWPFEQVLDAFPKNETIAIVEGPADVLRLLDAGAPAIANLGVSAWTSKKAELVSSHFKHVVLAMDNDTAGQNAQEFIKETFKGLTKVSQVRMGSKDPASLPNLQLKKLVQHINKR